MTTRTMYAQPRRPVQMVGSLSYWQSFSCDLLLQVSALCRRKSSPEIMDRSHDRPGSPGARHARGRELLPSFPTPSVPPVTRAFFLEPDMSFYPPILRVLHW